jgi:hypothetical protein
MGALDMDLRTFIASLTNMEQPKGPAVAYTPAHVIKALLTIDAEMAKGRIGLSKALGIGEGSVRTMIKKLTEKSVISVDSIGGCLLTPSGRSIVSELKAKLIASAQLDIKELDIQEPSFALQLRTDVSKAPLTKLRDIAVKYGADGMVIFAINNGIISFPKMTEDVSKTYPKLSMSLRSKFELKDGDALLVGFSKHPGAAELGTLEAALYLISY